MRHYLLITCLLLFETIKCIALTVPSEPTQDLAHKLPALPALAPPQTSYSLDQLESCKINLEMFRENDLEGYNSTVIDFTNSLNAFSKELETQKRQNLITLVVYNQMEDQLNQELSKCGNGGSLMKIYYQYLKQYQMLVQFVNDSILKKQIGHL